MFHPGVTAPPSTNSLVAAFEAYLVDTATGNEVPNSSAPPMVFHYTNVSDGRPDLSVGQRLVVAWPGTATDFVLESADTVTASPWTAVTNTPIVVDGQRIVILDNAAANRFFRLRSAP